MAESPSTMQSVKYIQDLLDELVERETHQTETLTAIQNEILTTIKGVENAIESLHSTYRSTHKESRLYYCLRGWGPGSAAQSQTSGID